MNNIIILVAMVIVLMVGFKGDETEQVALPPSSELPTVDGNSSPHSSDLPDDGL